MDGLVSLVARHGVGVLALAVATASACAQGASLQATATVTTPLAVTPSAPLAFGTLVPGIARTIAWNAATSGRLRVDGLSRARVALTLTLPTSLASGTATLPVANWSVRVGTRAATAGATPVTVTSGTPFVRRLPTSGQLFLFIGGRATPAASQPAGDYAGTITLDAAYTGT